MDEQTISQQLLAIILPVAVAAVSALTTWALYELKKWIKSRTSNEALQDSIDVLGLVIHNTVTRLNETVKVASEDGIITPDEALQLKTAAMQEIQKQIPPATKKILDLGITNLHEFISGQVEVSVLATKRQRSELMR